MSVPTRVAIYVRASTAKQRTEGQQRDLEDHARSRGWAVVRPYVEKVSATGKVERREYDRLLKDSRDPDRGWDHVLVWSLDRFSREERFTRAVDAIFDFEKLGVSFHSVKEPYLDSPPPGEQNLGRELLLGILPTIAAFESIRRSERVRVAMREIGEGRRATKSGRPPGRAWRVTREKVSEIGRLRSMRPPRPYSEIAQVVGLPTGTCRRVASQVRRGLDPLLTRSAHKGANPPSPTVAPIASLGSGP
jgi:DNA invertase Pin-like site-specific DNA recombinase